MIYDDFDDNDTPHIMYYEMIYDDYEYYEYYDVSWVLDTTFY